MRVSKSQGQNKLAFKTLKRLEKANAEDIRVDQAQVDSTGLTKVGTNRPDIQGSLDEQRVHVEFDRPGAGGQPGSRVDGHVDGILGNDPNSVAIAVPKK
jgi:hypothetical protein